MSKGDPLFTEPEFDEHEFLQSEKERAKAVVFLFIIGILIAYLSSLVWYIGVLLFFAVLVFNRPIFQMLKLELPKKASHRFFLFGEMFFTWLVFWIVFLNPPFAVNSGPQFHSPQQYLNGNWNSLNANGTSGQFTLYAHNSTELRVPIAYPYPMSQFNITESYASHSNLKIGSHFVGGYLYFNYTSFTGTATFTISLLSQNHGYPDTFYLE
ncbi:MAG: hypothetical protein M1151_05965 [Candidatus Thermoplasmatota archaeon]|jgi:hypothetical protein|nr:hypothetical protein [Candidatus Thermoplasmatota archaeon]MCL5786193.1 hypothetical protein [Candidatus Thermoplasmatota archaeon]